LGAVLLPYSSLSAAAAVAAQQGFSLARVLFLPYLISIR